MPTPILITLGDPAGIGAEVILKALASRELQRLEVTWQIVGSGEILEQTYDRLRSQVDAFPLANPAHLSVLDHPLSTVIEPGCPSDLTGNLSFQYLNTAVDQVLAGHGRAIVTAPIAKAAWMSAGHQYPGQTEFLAEKAGSDRFGMLFVAQSPHTGWILRTLLATTHIPLGDVPQALTPQRLTQKLDLLISSLRETFGISTPRIAIAGLNPHSGEEGKLGREEQDWMKDWLQKAQIQYPQATLEGLIPPDTLWVKPGQAWWQDPHQGHDGYLALYHDQGLIPVKLLAFDRAVNTTIGLPFLRTSPDHGTAFNIAGQGIAQPQSMIEALVLAAALTP